jgi:hypothetical protein
MRSTLTHGTVTAVDHHDVYRDADGNPVTITQQQFEAVWHAIHVREAIARENFPDGDMRIGPGSGGVNWYKSRLLGRMLFEGRPPLAAPPPLRMGGPAYWLTDPDLCPFCGRERNGPGGNVARTTIQPFGHPLADVFDVPDGTTIEECGEWRPDPRPDVRAWDFHCTLAWHSR